MKGTNCDFIQRMTKEDIYLILVDMLQEMFELDRSKITPCESPGKDSHST